MATGIHDLDSDVLGQILLQLDARDLVAVSAASLRLHDDIWLRLCLSSCPSLRHHRLLPLVSSNPGSFFTHAFSFPSTLLPHPPPPNPSELLSAVDLYLDGRGIFSTVVAVETHSPWFESAPFHIDAVEPNSMETTIPSSSADELTLSWMVIDPASGKAVNVSSRRAVAVERHWLKDGTRLKFGVALGAARATAAVVAVCEGEGMRVREVSLVVEGEEEGACLCGKDAVAVLTAAMDGQKTWKDASEVEERYMKYEKRKIEKTRKEEKAELGCALVGAAAFATFLAVTAFQWFQ